MSIYARLVILGLILLALAAGFWKLWHTADKAGYARAQMEAAAAADYQREANRGGARKAEEKHAVRTIYRDRFITKTTTEVRHATAALAACPVPDAAVGLLNRAAECAREDRPASCGVGDGVRSP